jgi:hypothetical protein
LHSFAGASNRDEVALHISWEGREPGWRAGQELRRDLGGNGSWVGERLSLKRCGERIVDSEGSRETVS